MPIGYAMLCDAMESDAELCARFFKNLRHIGFGGAVLPEQVAARLQKFSLEARAERGSATTAQRTTSRRRSEVKSLA